MTQAIPKTQYSNVEHQVKVAAGYVAAINRITEQQDKDNGTMRPLIDQDRIERGIRKRHAKFYGLDSKYDGKGNLRELTY